jgi:glycosyltransferase involved in cell wall biosynthesis
MSNSTANPTVSFVVPASNEADLLPATLSAIDAAAASVAHETLVVDGDSDDATRTVARDHGARVIRARPTGQGDARHHGARHASGRWLAFVDADTRVRPDYLEAMLAFVRERDLAGANSRCRVTGGWRTVPFELLFNHGLPRLSPPPFPGFNVFVSRPAYFDVGGFASGPNEDLTFSRRLGRSYPTATCPRVLVETSGRRMTEDGLLRTVGHYTGLEYRRLCRLAESRN